MGTKNGYKKWVQKMGTKNGYKKWVQKMGLHTIGIHTIGTKVTHKLKNSKKA
jgi:hypothetical protein